MAQSPIQQKRKNKATKTAGPGMGDWIIIEKGGRQNREWS